MTDLFKDIEITDWEEVEELVKRSEDIDWSQLPKDEDLTIGDLLRILRERDGK